MQCCILHQVFVYSHRGTYPHYGMHRPYTDLNYTRWDMSKIEMIHTQFVKTALGCNFHTSNIEMRGEVEVKPLLIEIINRVICYINNIKDR